MGTSELNQEMRLLVAYRKQETVNFWIFYQVTAISHHWSPCMATLKRHVSEKCKMEQDFSETPPPLERHSRRVEQ